MKQVQSCHQGHNAGVHHHSLHDLRSVSHRDAALGLLAEEWLTMQGQGGLLRQADHRLPLIA